MRLSRRTRLAIVAGALLAMATPAGAFRLGGIALPATPLPSPIDRATDPLLELAEPAVDLLGAELAILDLVKLQLTSKTPAEVTFTDGYPSFVRARVTPSGSTLVAKAKRFLASYPRLFAAPVSGSTLRARAITEDGDGVLFEQLIHGVPVSGSGLMVMFDGADVIGASATLVTTPDVETFPGIEAAEAEENVRAAVPIPSAVVPGSRLVLRDPTPAGGPGEPSPRLAWRVIVAHPGGEMFVDARTGEIFERLTWSADSTGFEALDLIIEDAEGDTAVDSDCFWSSDTVTLGDEDDKPISKGFSAWVHAREAYRFYHDVLDRHSYDGDDDLIEVFVHSGTDGGGSWNGGCETIETAPGWETEDVLTHEFTHGVLDFRPRIPLDYKNESGALEESLADVMGAINDQDWFIAEDVPGGPIRDMADPPDKGQPDKYTDKQFKADDDDNGGVHTNSGIMNKAWVLMQDGGEFNGISVAGFEGAVLGKNTMLAELVYKFMGKINSTKMTLPQAAQKLNLIGDNLAETGFFGFTHGDACTVQNALAAVELLNAADEDCDDVDDDVDLEFDNDGVTVNDNCEFVFNPKQIDTDGDDSGDACDQNDDEDDYWDDWDLCPKYAHPNNADSDGDGIGDACEDGDHDGDFDLDDNCPDIANPAQANQDGDTEGDACDDDIDGDGVPNTTDNCDYAANPDQKDTDEGGLGDVCDPNPNNPVDDDPYQGPTVEVADWANMPIDFCRAGCPESRFFGNDELFVYVYDIDTLTQVSLVDDHGRRIGRYRKLSDMPDSHTFAFVPEQGAHYFLSFNRSGDAGGDFDQVNVEVSENPPAP